MSLAKNISISRDSKGLSIEDVARKCNVSCSKVIDWEAGDLEPTIKELRMLSYILGVTIDELVKENDIIQVKNRHYLNASDYRELSLMMMHIERLDEISYMHPKNRLLLMKKLIGLIQYRFMNEEGEVYDEFLVENTDKDTRKGFVERCFRLYDRSETFKEYIEGKIEIDKAIKAMLDLVEDEWINVNAKLDFIFDSSECKPVYELNIIYELEEIEDYSEKKINEIKADLSEYIGNRSGNTLIDRLLLFFANEATEALEERSPDRIDNLIEIWKDNRNILLMSLARFGKKC